MIFPVMMFSLGFLCAFLVAILILPPIIRNSARRNSQPGQKIKPGSLKQARAETDRMRAEYAIAIRKQEQRAEQLMARSQQQLIEIAEAKAALRDLKREMSDITALADRRYQEKAQLQARLGMMQRAPGPNGAPKQTDAPVPAPEPADEAAELPEASPAPIDAATTPPAPEPKGKPRLPGITPGGRERSQEAGEDFGHVRPGLAGRILKLKNSK